MEPQPRPQVVVVQYGLRHRFANPCAAYTLIILNSLIIANGLTIGFNAAGRSTNNEHNIAFAVQGFVFCVYGIIGVLGAAYEYICLLITYVIWTVVLVLAIISIAIWQLVRDKDDTDVVANCTVIIIFAAVYITLAVFAYKLIVAIQERHSRAAYGLPQRGQSINAV